MVLRFPCAGGRFCLAWAGGRGSSPAPCIPGDLPIRPGHLVAWASVGVPGWPIGGLKYPPDSESGACGRASPRPVLEPPKSSDGPREGFVAELDPAAVGPDIDWAAKPSRPPAASPLQRTRSPGFTRVLFADREPRVEISNRRWPRRVLASASTSLSSEARAPPAEGFSFASNGW